MKNTLAKNHRKAMAAALLCMAVLAVAAALLAPLAALGGESVVVSAGLYENPPKIYRGEAGSARGFWPELLDNIAAQCGWEIRWIPCTWTGCLEMLRRGEIDVMPDVAFSKAREKWCDFSKVTVFLSWSQVYARPNSGITTVFDLRGKKIAVLKNSVNYT